MVVSAPDEGHDPGGKVRLKLQPGVAGDAYFSACKRYRTWLRRSWGDPVDYYALWIGMNPSTAEADVDDPTIRKEMHFTRQMGLSSYVKCNVMDYRATHPEKLLEWGTVPVSNENFECIRKIAASATVIVAAWGKLPKKLSVFAQSVSLMLNEYPIYCMGVNKDGSPKHPLYLSNDTQHIIWQSTNGDIRPRS